MQTIPISVIRTHAIPRGHSNERYQGRSTISPYLKIVDRPSVSDQPVTYPARPTAASAATEMALLRRSGLGRPGRFSAAPFARPPAVIVAVVTVHADGLQHACLLLRRAFIGGAEFGFARLE